MILFIMAMFTIQWFSKKSGSEFKINNFWLLVAAGILFDFITQKILLWVIT